jgi:hypothetical protein
MTETFTKYHLVVGNEVHNTVEYILRQVTGEKIDKSAATQSSQFKILSKTFDSMNSYKTYSFALNELEADFSTEDNSIRKLVLRDTEVDKKITFKKDAAELTFVKGVDAVGEATDMSPKVSREPVFWIKINGDVFHAPFNLVDVYEDITGTSVDDITQAEIEQELVSVNVWEEFKLQLQEENS